MSRYWPAEYLFKIHNFQSYQTSVSECIAELKYKCEFA